MDIRERQSFHIAKQIAIPNDDSTEKAALGTKQPFEGKAPPDDWPLPSNMKRPVKDIVLLAKLRGRNAPQADWNRADDLELRHQWDEMCWASARCMEESILNGQQVIPARPTDWTCVELSPPRDRLELRAFLCEKIWRDRRVWMLDFSGTGNDASDISARTGPRQRSATADFTETHQLDIDITDSRVHRQLVSLQKLSAQNWTQWAEPCVDLHRLALNRNSRKLRQPSASTPFGFPWPQRAPYDMAGAIDVLSYVYDQLSPSESFDDTSMKLFVCLLHYCVPHQDGQISEHGLMNILKNHCFDYVGIYHVMAVATTKSGGRETQLCLRCPLLSWKVDNLEVPNPPTRKVLQSNRLTRMCHSD